MIFVNWKIFCSQNARDLSLSGIVYRTHLRMVRAANPFPVGILRYVAPTLNYTMVKWDFLIWCYLSRTSFGAIVGTIHSHRPPLPDLITAFFPFPPFVP